MLFRSAPGTPPTAAPAPAPTHIALPKYYKYKLFTEDQREQLWIYRENSGEKFVGNFKIKITDEESEEYYNVLKKQHNEEGIKTHKDDIKEIIIKKIQNRRDKNKKSKAQRLFELYGKELRKKIQLYHNYKHH